MLSGYLSGLPAFAAYFATALVLVGLFATLYVRVTPHREFDLIRQGNLAAVLAFLGALGGFVLPLTTAMEYAVNWTDFVIWAAIAALVQIAAFFLARRLMPDVSERVAGADLVGGVWLGGMAILFGLLNAASMTP